MQFSHFEDKETFFRDQWKKAVKRVFGSGLFITKRESYHFLLKNNSSLCEEIFLNATSI